MGRSSSTAEQTAARRSVVPDAAGRSPWLAAVWTGLGAAIVCATAAIFVVALCWLPVSGTTGSGTTGRTNSAIRGGLLSFLASLHGGVTIDGVSAMWLPLGLPMIVGVTAWRAGAGLADAAEALGERDPLRLALVGAVQAVSFTVGCLVAAHFATLGTSRAPLLGVAAAALSLFAVTGGTSLVRSSALSQWCGEHLPSWLGQVVRAGAAAVAVYLTAGALLVLGSLAVHHRAVEALSTQVGGGWGSVPVLLLGILAAPNAVIAGSAYLAGPGFAVGAGTTVSLGSAAHGTLPAFPVLAAVPVGHGPNPVVWGLVGVTAVLAGVAAARVATRAVGWWRRLAATLGAAVAAGLIMLILGWQGGGSAGDARLRTVGASPWKLGAAVAGAVAAAGLLSLGAVAVWRLVRNRADSDADEDNDKNEDEDTPPVPRHIPRLIVVPPGAERPDDDAGEDGARAG